MEVEPRRAAGPVKKRSRVVSTVLVVLSVVLFAGGGTAVYFYWQQLHAPGHFTDLNGNIVVPEDPEATEPAFQDASNMVVDDGGAGFTVPAIKLDVKLGSINAVDDKMNPANFTSVFWVRNVGVGLDDADKGTVYMVTHAVQGGKAPGNILQDKGAVTLKPGDLIQADKRTYEFVSSEIIPKTEIGNHEDLWANEPGRMLIITCVLNPHGGIAVDNLVLVAKLVS